MLARAHKKFQHGQHSEIYLITLKEQDKTKMELPLDMVSLSAPSCRTNERLRASSPYRQNRQVKTKPVKLKIKKAMEFALLRCWPDDEDEPHHLKWDSVLASGMLTLDEDDNEKSIRNAIKDSLSSKFPVLGINDFDFVKVRHKAISKL